MKTRIFETICCVLLFLGLSSAGFVYAVMPLPAGSKIYSYVPTALPAVNADPSQAKPIGVGDVTSAHNLALKVGLDPFSAAVDIYLALYAPAVFPDLFLFQPNGNLAPLTSGLVPWKAATTGPVNEGLLGTIPMSLIPSGDYAFYLLVAPAGTHAASIFANCYLWVTSVGNLRVLDVSEKAASLFGGDVDGAAAILMALGRDHDIENVAKALLGGRLTQYGEILAAAAAKRTLNSENALPSFCDPGASPEGCRIDLAIFLGELLEQLEGSPLNRDFDKLVSAYTLYLASLGYSGTQIHEAIYGTLFGGRTRISLYADYEHPFGGIIFDSVDPDPIFVEPAKQHRRPPFSDFAASDQKKNDIPGTEGMTFPAYYKGTGTAREYRLVKSWGTFQCTLNDVVFVARVGGMGDLEKTLEVFMNKKPWLNRSGNQPKCDIDMPVQGSLWQTVKGEYTSEGIHHDVTDIKEVQPTYTVITYEESDIKFNKQFLWGNVYREMGIPEWEDYFELEYDFRLEAATEAEFKAVYPNY